MNCSTPGSSVLHYLLEFAQIHLCRVNDAIQPSRHLLPPSPSVFNLSQHHWGGTQLSKRLYNQTDPGSGLSLPLTGYVT